MVLEEGCGNGAKERRGMKCEGNRVIGPNVCKDVIQSLQGRVPLSGIAEG
jgi:hypothetical protein